jgi:mono/diheme cytochrome c family protein
LVLSSFAVVAATTALAQAAVSFTTAQAQRGAALYLERCSSCHGDDAQGDGNGITPPLASLEFRANWGGLPVSALLDRTRDESQQPGSRELSRPQQADVLAFILSKNAVAPGPSELPSDAPLLSRILLSSLTDR